MRSNRTFLRDDNRSLSSAAPIFLKRFLFFLFLLFLALFLYGFGRLLFEIFFGVPCFSHGFLLNKAVNKNTFLKNKLPQFPKPGQSEIVALIHRLSGLPEVPGGGRADVLLYFNRPPTQSRFHRDKIGRPEWPKKRREKAVISIHQQGVRFCRAISI